MKVFILISALLEIVVGVLLFFAADKISLLSNMSDENLSLLSLYGAAALAIGLFALSVWRNYHNDGLVRTFLSTFVIFHVAVAMAARGAYAAGALPDMNTAYLHGLLALITAYFWIKNKG